MAESGRTDSPMDTADVTSAVTTITTVAVQSGRAKIILAILKVSVIVVIVNRCMM